MIRALAGAGLAVALALSTATPSAAAGRPASGGRAAVSVVAIPPTIVLEKYAAALGAVKQPPAFSFEYALDQSGAHNLSARHRVYRSGTTERDETIAINGQRTRRPEVRIFRNRADRYALARLAPHADAYAFTPAGTLLAGKHRDYSFRLTPLKPQTFRIDRMIIDGVTFLPRSLDYTMHAGANVGTGTLVFGKSDKYWVIGSATATVGESREKIAWSAYRFIAVMPRATFVEPRPLPSASIAPLTPSAAPFRYRPGSR